MTEATHPGSRPSSRMTAREWLLLLVLAAVQFTHIVDFMIIMPLGPVYMREMTLSPDQFGLVVAAYTVSAGVAGLLAAQFLDRFDRKHALLTLYAGFTGGTLLCAVAQDYLSLVLARTVAGAFGGVAAAVVLAIIGDAFHDSRRGFATGIVMSAFSVASIAGVPLGLHLADEYGWSVPFVVLGALSAGVLLLAALVLPPMRGHFHGRHQHQITYWAVLAHGNHVRAFALTVALVMSSFLLAPYFAPFLVGNVGVGQTDLKYLYLYGGLVTLGTMPLVGRLSDTYGKLVMFRIMAIATAVVILVMTNLPAGLEVPLVFTVTTAFMVASSGRMVPAMALITASSAPNYRGRFMSLNAAMQHLTSGLAAWGGGLLLVEHADHSLDGFALLGILACIAVVVSLFLAGRLRTAVGGTLAPDSVELTPQVAAVPGD